MVGAYLVLKTTLGSIRGISARLFEKGEIVALEDADLAGVGVRDGWLQPVDQLDAVANDAPETDWVDPLTGAKGACPEDYAEYVVVDPVRLPIPEGGAWGGERPAAGDVIGMSAADAAELVTAGVLELRVVPAAPEKKRGRRKKRG